MALAMRAVAMTARMRHKGLLMAFSAAGQHPWTGGSTTELHVTQSLKMRRQNFPPVLIQKVCFKLFDDG
jgi:hypothetical protein